MPSLNKEFLSSSFVDQSAWDLEPLSLFSSKSIFLVLFLANPSASPFSSSKIWKPPIPPRVKVFSWTAVLNRINTMNILQRKRPFMSLSPH